MLKRTLKGGLIGAALGLIWEVLGGGGLWWPVVYITACLGGAFGLGHHITRNWIDGSEPRYLLAWTGIGVVAVGAAMLVGTLVEGFRWEDVTTVSLARFTFLWLLCGAPLGCFMGIALRKVLTD